ncbi:S1 family peptidase [Congregicoccus parvus]|uniref:S1 family peptidase n=1 Tax=Congregicoccus parvus TaxID=3081749 RepID=UPI003FA53B96
MNTRFHHALLVVASCVGFATVGTSAATLSAEAAEQGRAVLARHADAIIGVEVVVTLRGNVGGRPVPEQENKVEANGTVLSPDGLTVLSLGAIDPRVRINRPDARLEEPEFKEVKLQLADGTEFPARVVFKDEDLDLAFVAPSAPSNGAQLPVFAAVDLAQDVQAQILGNYFEVARASKSVQRTPAVRVVNVIGIVPGPREFLLATTYAMGCPVFDGEGRVLGIGLRHVVDGRQVGNAIVPAVDIAEVAEQAAEAARR